MTSLRKSILFMLVHLTVVFNLERFNYGEQNVIDIPTFVYVLIIGLVAVTLIIKSLQALSVYSSVLLWLAVYGVLKLLVFPTHPILGGLYTFLTIIEITLITITVFLTHELSRSLREFEEVIERVTLQGVGHRVLHMREAGEDIKTEFIRSRRHNRPLSILVVDVNTNTPAFNFQKTVKEIQRGMLLRYLASSLSRILSKEARRTDIIVEKDDERGFIMLCPETTAEGTMILAERIQQTASQHLGIHVDYGVASFPDEALTFEELLQRAQQNLSSEHETVFPIPPPVPAEEQKPR